jgi:REP element-mobilizing transposase RayT
MKQSEYRLDESHRDIVLQTVQEVAMHRHWQLWAAHVRGNHLHAVVSAGCKPEKVMSDFKSWASRRLRESFSESPDRERWTEHGSTKYLWDEDALARAIEYVVNGQGESMAVYDSRVEPAKPKSEPEASATGN